jgi:hypothetical protein
LILLVWLRCVLLLLRTHRRSTAAQQHSSGEGQGHATGHIRKSALAPASASAIDLCVRLIVMCPIGVFCNFPFGAAHSLSLAQFVVPSCKNVSSVEAPHTFSNLKLNHLNHRRRGAVDGVSSIHPSIHSFHPIPVHEATKQNTPPPSLPPVRSRARSGSKFSAYAQGRTPNSTPYYQTSKKFR